MNIKCGCGQTLSVRDDLVGQAVRCPTCNTVLKVPDGRTAAPARPAGAVTESNPAANRSAANPSRAPRPATNQKRPKSKTTPSQTDTGKIKFNKENIHAISLVASLLGVGLIGLVGGMVMAGRAMAASSWETTDGVVLSSRVGSSIKKKNRLKGPKNQLKQSIAIEYEYVVNDVTYTNDLISFRFSEGNDIDSLNALSQKYSKGSAVQIHFNPSDPSSSVLESGVPGMAWIFLLAGITMLIGGGFLVPGRLKQLRGAA